MFLRYYVRMIRQITGKIAYAADNFVILEAGGVGYKVVATADTLAAIETKGKSATLWTHLAVRENAMDLYGFLSKKDLDFFELMLTISGIGPKKAMGILSAASFETIRKAVATGDPSYLQKISGIGKKNAEKIIIELADKIEKIEGDTASLKEEIDALDALQALGYSAYEAKDALAAVSKKTRDVGARVREALKNLGKQ